MKDGKDEDTVEMNIQGSLIFVRKINLHSYRIDL